MKYPKKLREEVAMCSQNFKLEGFLEGQGPVPCKIMLIGEAPGKTEIERAIPFCGLSGRELEKNLNDIGLFRKDLYITSTVRSRPYHLKQVVDKKTGQRVVKTPNRTPTKKEVLAHAPLLDWEIQHVNPELILALGNISLQRLLGERFRITDCHGKLFKKPIQQLNQQKDGYEWTKKAYAVIPIFHPAAIFYNRKLVPEIEADWLKIKAILNKF
ncbi:uracil-DNA glycosylase [Enterococcus saccharolyticus]|uniref:uracil-DNA glycosylase n=1 Tax=Enterococcus saccharolyticus TaxID=41997 RepID=UPI001E2AA65C|nr:uracil-DNA glycosylase [Enterococcus saccharolyticus]MCD5002623.1 uracil-DNA glycosylase [Enterococcus saccharolyticus]